MLDLYCLPTVRLTHKLLAGRLPFGAIVAIVVDRRSIDPTSSNLIMLILPYSDGADGALVMVMPFLKSLYNPFINP